METIKRLIIPALMFILMVLLAFTAASQIVKAEEIKTDIWEEYNGPQTLYTTTGLNMRVYPSLESEVVKVLPRNSEVAAVGSNLEWTKIVLKNNFGVDEYYYLSNRYLSDEKQVNTYLGKFKLTAYCNCSRCCGQWAGGATASGRMPSAGRTVAMGGVPFGTKLLINGHVYTVDDRGTPYGHVDIYHNSHSEALNFGLRYADVYRVD